MQDTVAVTKLLQISDIFFTWFQSVHPLRGALYGVGDFPDQPMRPELCKGSAHAAPLLGGIRIPPAYTSADFLVREPTDQVPAITNGLE